MGARMDGDLRAGEPRHHRISASMRARHGQNEQIAFTGTTCSSPQERRRRHFC
jgi:hypothetical protein